MKNEMNGKIDKNKVETLIGLTPAQRGMLFQYLADPHSSLYFTQTSFLIERVLSLKGISTCWNKVIAAHQVLRGVFRWREIKEPVGVILKEKSLRSIIAEKEEEGDSEEFFKRILQRDREQGIDLENEPFRITFAVAGDTVLMIVTYHHILLDGLSLTNIVGDFWRLYRGGDKELPPRGKYSDYITRLKKMDPESIIPFWRDYVMGVEEKTSLPFYRQSGNEAFSYELVDIEFNTRIRQQIDSASKSYGVTFAAFIHCAWAILLQRYNLKEDVTFAITLSGRSLEIPHIHEMAGMFISTLPFRLQLAGTLTAKEALKRTTQTLQAVNDHGIFSIHESRSFLPFGNDPMPFASLLVIDSLPFIPGDTSGEGPTISYYSNHEIVNFDLTVQVVDFQVAKLRIHYNRHLFDATDIRRIASHLFRVLAILSSHSEGRLSEIVIADPAELDLIKTINNTALRYDQKKSLLAPLYREAGKIPAARALHFKQLTLSYGELVKKIDAFAFKLLTQYNLHSKERVILVAECSPSMVIAALAIIRANATCVPVDPAFPPERNRFIMSDCNARYIIGPAKGEMSCEVKELEFVPLEDEDSFNGEREVSLPAMESSVPPFIIYTSGSTGNPKGVLLTHKGIMNHAFAKIDVLEIGSEDIVACTFSINVIACLWQILSPLYVGGRLQLVEKELTYDPYSLYHFLEEREVTIAETIPSLLSAYLYLIERGEKPLSLKKLRYLALTTEEIKPTIANNFYKYYSIPLVNCYGQTECCDDVLHYHIPVRTDLEKIPIGIPCRNTHVHISDQYGNPQPVGVMGEICVTGDGVSLGYWNREEVNREKFCFDKEGKAYLYKTGDLGCREADGTISYLGRLDHQVKIRGNRVELREIENRLSYYDAIESVAAIVRGEGGNLKLVCFYTALSPLNEHALREYLQRSLPDFMIPNRFVYLEKMPVLGNGKINRRALREMKEISAPPANVWITGITNSITGIWQELLGRKDFSAKENFFDVGGHSLLLIQMKVKLEEAFGCEIRLLDLFNYVTVDALSRYITERVHGTKKEMTDEEHERLSFERKGGHVSNDIAVIGVVLRIPGADTPEAFWEIITEGKEVVTRLYTVTQQTGGRNLPEEEFIVAYGMLEGIEEFDAGFFGLSNREAEIIDPQQRLYWQCAWQALENSGYVDEHYAGRIGVYTSVGLNSYMLNNVLCHPKIMEESGLFQVALGNDKDFISTRFSYFADLSGPSVTLQSACSSSLMTIHMARQGILSGDCDIAVAGGVYVFVPGRRIGYNTDGGNLSPKGCCRPFDAQADGTVFSNGIGIVVLKRLETALRDNDTIYGIIKGSALNNDGGKKIGYTAPSEKGQVEALTLALKEAGVEPSSVRYIETHGVGTPMGDPIEITALKRVYGPGVGTGHYALGSVKANIGHLNTSAGVIGFIKTLYALKKGIIPPLINLNQINPLLGIENSPFSLPVGAPQTWPETEVRRAAVSCFGIGGTNVHIIMEAPPQPRSGKGCHPYHLILLSAKNPQVLSQMRTDLKEFLRHSNPDILASAGYTLAVGRKRFRYTLAFACQNVQEAISLLEEDSPNQHVIAGEIQRDAKPVAFLLTGSVPGNNGFYSILYSEELAFRNVVDEFLHALQAKGIIIPSAEKLFSAVQEDPPLQQFTAILGEYALSRLYESWGMKAGIYIGWGLGEISAMLLAGLLLPEMMAPLIFQEGQKKRDELQLVSNPEMPKGAVLCFSSALGDWISEKNHAQVLRCALTEKRFDGAHIIEKLYPEDYFYLEINPQGKFRSKVADLFEIAPDDVTVFPGALPPGNSVERGVYDLLCRFWCAGITIDWQKYFHGADLGRIPLPSYPFMKQRHWLMEQEDVTFQTANNQELCKRPREEWYYLPVWRQTPLIRALAKPGVQEHHKKGKKVCLIFSSPLLPLGELCDAFGQKDYSVVIVERGEQCNEEAGGNFIFNPNEIDQYDNLISTIRQRYGQPQLVLHGWSLDEYDENNSSSVAQFLTHNMDGILFLTKALAKGERDGATEILLLTKGVGRIERGDELYPLNAMLYAAALIIPQEHARLECRCLDLGFGESNDMAAHILSELESADNVKLAAYRGETRWSIDYKPCRPPASAPVGEFFTSGGVYIIVGGLGKIGLTTARFLAQRCDAPILILTGRSSFPTAQEWDNHLSSKDHIKEKILTLRAMAASGATVEYVQADVTNETEMAKLFSSVKSRHGKINGVFYNAGVTDASQFAPMERLTPAECRTHYHSKVDALPVLARLLAKEELDFCLLSSSLSPILGGIGLYAYTAANCFLNAFAEKVRGVWSVLQWERWQHEELLLSSYIGTHSSARELSITKEEGESILDDILLLGGCNRIVVSTGDLNKRLEQWVKLDRSAEQDSGNLSWTEEEINQEGKLEAFIAAVWGDLLGVKSVGLQDDFFVLGGQSLQMLRFINRIRETIGIRVPVDVLFYHSTVEDAARLLRDLYTKSINISMKMEI